MANVVNLRRFFPIQPITAEQIEVRDTLLDTMTACPRCADRGWIFFKCVNGSPDAIPCPCGGTDADRIELDEVV